jgi:hypothetical protein
MTREGAAKSSEWGEVVPAARLELAHLAAADFESATSTDFVTRADGAKSALRVDGLCHVGSAAPAGG